MDHHTLKPLIVDDDETVRREICAFLRDKCNMDPVPLGSGEEALDLLDRSKNGYRVVLSDISMSPGMGGDELLRKIRAHHPGVEVVLMSAYQDHNAAVTAVNEHAFALLRKPMDLRQVARLLREAAKLSQVKEERRQLVEAFEEWVHSLKDPDSFQVVIGTKSYSPGQLLKEVQCGSEVGEEYLKALLVTAVEIVSGRYEMKEK